MNLFELFVKIGIDDQASGKLSKLSSSLGKGLKTAAKVGVAAIGAASTAIVALGKVGLDYNKQMETYTTNFEVMMGDAEAAALKVEELKEMGARTPFELGDLANATQTLLAFNVSADDSTGVLQRLGDISLGNVQKLESLTRAYGKMNASQKVTLEDINMMIDAGFNPLLIVAEETGKTMTEVYDDISKGKVSFEQIEDAISKATTAGGQFYEGMQKASQTVEGLISTLKDNATALVGEVYMPISEGLQKTVLPSAINAISTLSEAFKENGIEGMIAAVGEMLGSLVSSIVEHVPEIVGAAVSLIKSFADGISQNSDTLAGAVFDVFEAIASEFSALIESFTELIPELLDSILEELPGAIESIVSALTDGGVTESLTEAVVEIVQSIADNLPNIIQAIVDAIPKITKSVNNAIRENFPTFLQAVVDLIVNIVRELPSLLTILTDQIGPIMSTIVSIIIENLPLIIEAIVTIVFEIIKALPEILQSIWTSLEGWMFDMAKEIGNQWPVIKENFQEAFSHAIDGIKEAWDGLMQGISELWNKLTDWFASLWESMKKIGSDIVNGIWEGLKESWHKVVNWFNEAWNNLVGGVKNFLGIHSPSKVFAGIGKNMALGVGEGWQNSFSKIKDDINKSMVFDDATIAINSSVKRNDIFGHGSVGGVSVVQNIYSEAKTAADLMQEAIYQQERAVLLGV